MRLSNNQIEIVANELSKLSPDEFNQVRVDVSNLGKKLGMSYNLAMRALRSACKTLGYPTRGSVVEVTTKPTNSSEAWASERENIARNLGLMT